MKKVPEAVQVFEAFRKELKRSEKFAEISDSFNSRGASAKMQIHFCFNTMGFAETLAILFVSTSMLSDISCLIKRSGVLSYRLICGICVGIFFNVRVLP